MPVNTYKFNTCAYWCCEAIKKMCPTITIKASSVKTELDKNPFEFYSTSTINNALLRLARDGHLKRESTNMRGETIYIKVKDK